MKHRGEHWTLEEIELMKQLYQEGVIVDNIAPRVNHSSNAIGKKLKELGLSNRRIDWTQNELEE